MTRYNSKFIQNEKFWFTKQRSAKLIQYNSETRQNILRLENIYGNVCFTPLDIPIIYDENFYNWYFETAVPTVKQNKDIATDQTGSNSFLSLDIIPENIDPLKSVWSKNVVKNFDKLWPKLWQQWNEYFPFEKIIGVSMWSSVRDIIPHRDHTLFLDLPLEFRMIVDKNPTSNLYVSEVLPNELVTDQSPTAEIPTNYTTNSFVWNNLRSQHHSRYFEEYKKITVIFQFINPIDWKKYENLLERSIEKHKSNSLVSNKKLSDFIFVQQ